MNSWPTPSLRLSVQKPHNKSIPNLHDEIQFLLQLIGIHPNGIKIMQLGLLINGIRSI